MFGMPGFMPPPPEGGGGGGGRRFYRETDEKPNITWGLVRRALGYFAPYWRLIAVVVLAIAASSLLGLVPPVLTKNIIDVALPNKDLGMLALLIALSLAVTVLANLVQVAQSYLNSLVSKRIIKDMRNKMFSHLQSMPVSFFANVKSGEIISRINNDIGGVEGVFSNSFVSVLQNAIVFASTAATLFITNWQLALVSLLILPMFVAPTRKVGKIRWSLTAKTQELLARMNDIIYESLNAGGNILIKLFTKEKEKEREFRQVNEETTRLQIRESLAGRWFFMVVRTFVSIGPMLIYLAGGYLLIRRGDITVGGIVMFVSLLGRLYEPVTAISNVHVDVVRSMAMFERIFQYFDIKPEIADSPDAAALDSVRGDIAFKNVSFSYGGGVMVLKDVSFEVKAGQMAAFVGPSGAGKSTITSLVPRLYEASEGIVTVDGRDVRKVTMESLRRSIGMVTQDTYLFNASIRDNLLFARADASEEELISACKTANIHDFIMSLPAGYDTIVGERGIKLSGGEKQRISIARALLKDPRIIIFDEATSSLDSASELLIQQAVEPLLKGRTSLVIAHRLSTVMAADVIFVVEDGRIVESGTHYELLEQNGVYRDLFEKQFRPRALRTGFKPGNTCGVEEIGNGGG